MSRGKFITIEGIEGVGKSTNIEAIKNELDANGISYVLTREPGGTLLAEKIRALLLKESDEAPVEMSELLLVFAARAQHLEKVIIPTLKNGDWVICDRFTDATYAYQGGGRGLNFSTIAELESMVQGELRPDLTIILDLDPDTGLARARDRGELDRFENEQKIFFDKVRSAYLNIAKKFPDRCVVINAANDIERVSTDILRELRNRFFN
ncbi:MAG: dTMP kinase [Gammaproteobacteria bacterium]|nr:dTMP kinase [Gammaproteobacteria bacterium]MDD9958158.1 dTMP kinase [Gammaproteobacteria bacterium]